MTACRTLEGKWCAIAFWCFLNANGIYKLAIMTLMLLVCCFETQSCYEAQADLKPTIPLPRPPACRNCMLVLSCCNSPAGLLGRTPQILDYIISQKVDNIFPTSEKLGSHHAHVPDFSSG